MCALKVDYKRLSIHLSILSLYPSMYVCGCVCVSDSTLLTGTQWTHSIFTLSFSLLSDFSYNLLFTLYKRALMGQDILLGYNLDTFFPILSGSPHNGHTEDLTLQCPEN